MLKGLAAALAATAVLAALALTNPREDDHRRTVIEHVRAQCGQSVLARALCGGLMEFASANLTYGDYRIFSTGRLGHMETLGVLGKVVVVREE